MSKTRVGLFVNAGWNLLNFRRELMIGLAGMGCELHLIVPAPLDELREYGVVHCVPLDPHGIRPWRELGVLLKLRRLLKGLELDFLLTFTIKPNLYGAMIGGSCGASVICNVTGLGESFIFGGARQYLVRCLYRIAMPRASRVFVQNDDDADLLKHHGLVASGKVRRLPGSGVNTSHYRPTEWECRDTSASVRFLFIGRFRADKGFLEFVEAARLLRRAGSSAKFVAVGKAEAGRRASIPSSVLAHVREEGVVELLDYVSDIRPLISSVDCVVLPSYREGMARSLLEAASMERPIIASDVPGCRDALINGVTGFLCRVRDVADLARVMNEFCAMEPDSRVRMGKSGRSFMESHFGVDRVVDAYCAELRELARDRVSGNGSVRVS